MQNERKPLIEFRNVIKNYHGENVLDGVNLRVYPGEFLFIVGSSGAGKSTFLKLISTEEHPDSGEVLFMGRSLEQIIPQYLPYFRRRISSVYQDFRLIENRSVYDNIALPLRISGFSSRRVRARVSELLSLVDLKGKGRSRAAALSGGEKQRVALARALAANPLVLLADEPTGNVDPKRSVEIIGLLDKINCNYGTTILMVTHEHVMARRFHRRVVALERGRVVEDSVPRMNEKVLQRELDKLL